MTAPVDFAAFLAHDPPSRGGLSLSRSRRAGLGELLVALDGLARSRAPSARLGSARGLRGFKSGSSFLGDAEPAWVSRVSAEIAERKRQRVTHKRRNPGAVPDLQVEFQPMVRAALEVHLPYDSLEAIQRELRWGAQEDVEVGGFLWANEVPSRDGPVLVTKASEPAPDSKHGHSAVRLGLGRHVKQGFPSYLSHLVQVGDFHTHPSKNGRPSQTDYESWAERLRCSDVGLPYYVGIVVTRAKDGMGWMVPEFRAYVVYQKEPGGTRFVCEPARVVEL